MKLAKKTVARLKSAGTVTAVGLAMTVGTVAMMKGWATTGTYLDPNAEVKTALSAAAKSDYSYREELLTPTRREAEKQSASANHRSNGAGNVREKENLEGTPDTVQRSGFPSASKHKRMGAPSKHNKQVGQVDAARTGNWIGKLMPGKSAAATNVAADGKGTVVDGYWVDSVGKVLRAKTDTERQHFAAGERLGLVRKAVTGDVAGVVDVPEWRGTGKPNNYTVNTASRGAGHILEGAALGYVKGVSVTSELGWNDL